MDVDHLYAVLDDDLIPLNPSSDIPLEVLAALPGHLEELHGESLLAIGYWNDAPEGPLVLGLSRSGDLVTLTSVSEQGLPTLAKTIGKVDHWLEGLDLRSLSELSGDRVAFYDGLLSLSPSASIVLSGRRHYLLATSIDSIDTSAIEAQFPHASFQVRHVNVFGVPDGPLIVRVLESGEAAAAVETQPPAPSTQPAASETQPTAPPSTPPPVLEAEPTALLETPPLVSASQPPPPSALATQPSTPMLAPNEESPDLDLSDDLDDARDASVIDLTEDSDHVAHSADVVEGVSSFPNDQATASDPETSPGRLNLVQGETFDLHGLPLLFDATGESLVPISNELFAVDDAIVIVVALPERRRDTPFEDRRRFRWDTSLDRIQLLNDHSVKSDGTRRPVHLFVESTRQPDYAAYVGQLKRTAFQTQTETNAETAWFSISPSLRPDLYRVLRKGRLPVPSFDVRA